MDNPKRFQVGDEVVLVRNRGGAVNTVVTKVGRKYFWVKDSYHYQKFYLENGREVTDYGAADRVTTREIEAEERRRAELENELRKRGIRFDRPREWSSQALTRILDAAAGAGVDRG